MELLQKIVWPDPGKYIVAVSGGVDSMALLDALVRSQRGYELVTAYFDHGWRDTAAEWDLIQGVRASSAAVHLKGLEPSRKSEAEARRARYEALEELRHKEQATAVITAHHQDDLIETAVLNVLRGTGRRGLSPFASRPEIVRPLINVSKSQVLEYAHNSHLAWAEDPTNDDTNYRRNWVRQELLPGLRVANPQLDASLLSYISEARGLNARVNHSLTPMMHTKGGLNAQRVSIQSTLVAKLSVNVLQELLAQMMYALNPVAEPSSRTIEQLAIDLKCHRLRGERPLGGRLFASVAHDTVAIAFKAP
jgi:tRNA(Ile)-lysidine synthase